MFSERLRTQSPAIGTWLSLSDPTVAEISAELGFDFLILDLEHTPTSLESLIDMVRSVDAANGETAAIVRLPWNDPTVIKRVLDTGVSGVMAPMVENSTEAESLVKAAKYPPEGIRGVASSRDRRYGIGKQSSFQAMNREVITIPQIETIRGVENAGEIAAVEGIDGVFVGPADLSARMGIYGEWESQEYREAVDKTVDAVHASGTAISTLGTDLEVISELLADGFDFPTIGTDTRAIIERGQQILSEFEHTKAVDSSD